LLSSRVSHPNEGAMKALSVIRDDNASLKARGVIRRRRPP
jgi:hypothetical protein